jgi:hypothetical protein
LKHHLKSGWPLLGAVAAFGIFIAVTLVGLFAVNLFVFQPLLKHVEPNPTDVVMGFCVLSVGVLGIVGVFLRTKCLMWLNYANISFWFLLYGVVFDVTHWYKGVAPSLHSVIYLLFVLAATLVFAVLSYRSRNPNGAQQVKADDVSKA